MANTLQARCLAKQILISAPSMKAHRNICEKVKVLRSYQDLRRFDPGLRLTRNIFRLSNRAQTMARGRLAVFSVSLTNVSWNTRWEVELGSFSKTGCLSRQLRHGDKIVVGSEHGRCQDGSGVEKLEPLVKQNQYIGSATRYQLIPNSWFLAIVRLFAIASGRVPAHSLTIATAIFHWVPLDVRYKRTEALPPSS